MKHASKTWQLPHQHGVANDLTIPHKTPRSIRQCTFNGNDRDGNHHDFDEYSTRIDSTSDGLLGIDTPCIGFQPTLRHIREANVVGSFAQLEYHESRIPDIEPGNICIEVTVRDLGDWSESDKSTCSSLVLTPSSSITSLKSLGQDPTYNPSKVAISYSAHVLKISTDPEVADLKTDDLSKHLEDDNGDNSVDHRYRTIRDNEIDTDTGDTCRYEDNLNIDNLFQTRKNNVGGEGRGSNKTFLWSPDEEIRKAQSRFRKYGKKLPTIWMDTQKAAPRIPPVSLETISNLYQVQVDGRKTGPWSGEKMSWWRWLTSRLSRMCLARTKAVDGEGVMLGNMPGSFGESNVAEELTRPPQAKLSSTSH